LKWHGDNVKQVMAPGALDPLTKELVYIAVSITNNCPYCIASHTASGRGKGMTDEQFAELLAVIGLANETNRVAIGYGVPIADVMSVSHEYPAEVMRPAAGLHGDDAGGKLCGQTDQRLPLGPPAHNERARCVEADDATNILAEIDAEHGNSHDLPLRLNFRRTHNAGRRGGPFHKTSRPSGRDRAREKKVDPGAIEIWFADEARIGQKNKITWRCARRVRYAAASRAVTTEIPHK
jgi:AhpD family alkylhydroperoxidase